MESRIQHLLLSATRTCLLPAMLALCTVPVQAEETSKADEQLKPVIDPEIVRRELNEADIDTENFEVGLFFGIISIEDFGSNSVYGARLTYHVTEDLFIEGTYGLSKGGKTSFENLSGGAPLLTDEQRDYTYYNASLGFNLLPGEAFVGSNHSFNTAFYVVAGAGSTKFAGDERFTLNYGVGYRFIATDFMAFHMDFRDHFFNIDLLGTDKTAHNLEFTASATLFF